MAVTLFVAILLWAMFHHASQLPLMHVGQTYTAFGLFVLFSSTQESFLIGNHFLMVIFIAGLFGPVFDAAVRSGVIAGPRTAG